MKCRRDHPRDSTGRHGARCRLDPSCVIYPFIQSEMLEEVSLAPSSEQHAANQFVSLGHAAGLMHSQINNSQRNQEHESSPVLQGASGAFLPMDLHLAQGYSFFASSHSAR